MEMSAELLAITTIVGATKAKIKSIENTIVNCFLDTNINSLEKSKIRKLTSKTVLLSQQIVNDILTV